MLPHFLEVTFETQILLYFLGVTFEAQILPYFLGVTFETQRVSNFTSRERDNLCFKCYLKKVG
jgi:hypothetical protein